MKIYKHRIFAKWANDEEIDNSILKEAISEIQCGLFDANLGAGLYKKRVSRPGRGKRGGYRTLVAFKQDNMPVFVLGFSKSMRENISDKELAGLKKLARYYLSATPLVIYNTLEVGELIEVKYDA